MGLRPALTFMASALAIASAALLAAPYAPCQETAPPVAVSLAPDQPIPYVYEGDPLIIELAATENVTVTGEVEVLRLGQRLSGDALPEVTLNAGAVHWWPVQDIPAEKGRYRARVKLSFADGKTAEFEDWFCRIDRPFHVPSDILAIDLPDVDPQTLFAVKSVSLPSVRIDASEMDVAEAVPRLKDSGLYVTVGLGASGSWQPAEITALVEQVKEGVARWEVAASEGPERLKALIEAIRAGGSWAPIGLVAESASEVEQSLSGGVETQVLSLVVRRDTPDAPEIVELRSAAERSGCETFPLYVLGRCVAEIGDDSGGEVVRQLLTNISAGAACTEIHADAIYDDGAFQSPFVYLTAFVQHLGNAVYTGTLPDCAPVVAHVFRIENTWCLVLWNEEYPRDVKLAVGEAEVLALTDARNNLLPAPSLDGGSVAFHLGAEPRYLKGSGGDVIARAARSAARTEAQRFVDAKVYAEQLPEKFTELMKLLASPEVVKPERDPFFALLKMLLTIERDWRSGTLPQSTAVPALAGLSRIIKNLCILEQESGIPFDEPIETTLEKCGGWKTQYITSTTLSGAQVRGEWLLAEVDRLMAESASLVAEGRAIEANGIAQMAEWRARSLETRQDANTSR